MNLICRRRSSVCRALILTAYRLLNALSLHYVIRLLLSLSIHCVHRPILTPQIQLSKTAEQSIKHFWQLALKPIELMKLNS